MKLIEYIEAQPEPTLRLSLIKEYLEREWRIKDSSIFSASEGKIIQSIDSRETLCHVEPAENNLVATIWRINAWKLEWNTVRETRIKRDIDSKLNSNLSERIRIISRGMATHTGLNTVTPFIDVATALARQSNAVISNLLLAYKIDATKLEDILSGDTVTKEIRAIYYSELNKMHSEPITNSINVQKLVNEEKAKQIRISFEQGRISKEECSSLIAKLLL